MSDRVVIDRIRPEDAEAMRAMILAIQRDEFGFDITLADQPDLADGGLFDTGGFYTAGDGAFWVARDRSDVVGAVALRDCGDRLGALRKMFVAPTHRGRDAAGSSVSANLLEALLAHARAAGFERLLLGTTERFVAAHRFYEKHGWTRIDEAELPPSFPRMSVDTRFYELRLG